MEFDLIVIGSGPGGQRAAMQGAKAGKKVAVIEECAALGGGCVHVGTIPSKSFRESVYRWSLSSRGSLSSRATLGQEREHAVQVREDGSLPNMERLLRRRDRVVLGESQVVFDQLSRNDITVIPGRASFVSPNEVEVSAPAGIQRYRATYFVIATGSSPVAPSGVIVDGEVVFDSNSILNLKKLPKSLIVLGAGVIGCEYASMFSMAGTKVYLLDKRHEILASVDREIVNHLVERFVHEGMEVVLEAETERFAITPAAGERAARAAVHLKDGRAIEAEALLITQGRCGNTQGLGLDQIGISATDRCLIPVDRHFRTSVSNIYAVGDVIGAPALASTSMEQGRLATCHAFGLEDTEMAKFFPYGIYTIPEISMIGPNEEELAARKVDFVVGRSRYRELARGQIVGDSWGLLKLLVDRSTLKLLGVHIIGDNAAELLHIGQAVMAFQGDVQYFIRSVFNYPTLAEAYKTAAFHAVNQIRGTTRTR